MKKPLRRIIFIFLLVFAALFAALPRHIPVKLQYYNFSFERSFDFPSIDFQWGQFSFKRDLELHLGLDIAGGSHLVFEADMSKLPQEDFDAAIEGVRNTIERRVNLFGVSEAQVQTIKTDNSYRVAADLPGLKNTKEAIALVGQTASLEFYEFVSAQAEESTNGALAWEIAPTNLTGADLKRARVEFDPNTGEPAVGLQFNEEGAKKFQEITKRNVGKPLAMFIDGEPIDKDRPPPVVQEEIAGGSAVISGSFTLEDAKKLAVQLNSGALPVPIKLIEQRTIEASLGSEFVSASVLAGFVGLSGVLLFMLLYYGRLGIIASLVLVFYGLFTVALYKLIPVVLTLPGIAGFILSLGMAVDSNILIFERMKEELRAGKPWIDSMEAGFGRAWDSIRDANIATLLIVFILLNPMNFDFLHTSGPVRGFALTLGIGVLMSLFTGVFVSRTLMRIFLKGNK